MVSSIWGGISSVFASDNLSTEINGMMMKVEQFAAKENHVDLEKYLKERYIRVYFHGLQYLGRKDEIITNFKNSADNYTHYIHGCRIPHLERLRLDGRLKQGMEIHLNLNLFFCR